MLGVYYNNKLTVNNYRLTTKENVVALSIAK